MKKGLNTVEPSPLDTSRKQKSGVKRGQQRIIIFIFYFFISHKLCGAIWPVKLYTMITLMKLKTKFIYLLIYWGIIAVQKLHTLTVDVLMASDTGSKFGTARLKGSGSRDGRLWKQMGDVLLSALKMCFDPVPRLPWFLSGFRGLSCSGLGSSNGCQPLAVRSRTVNHLLSFIIEVTQDHCWKNCK